MPSPLGLTFYMIYSKINTHFYDNSHLLLIFMINIWSPYHMNLNENDKHQSDKTVIIKHGLMALIFSYQSFFSSYQIFK